MRRKLVRQGKGALTLSLPKKWIEFNELNAGDEVIVEDRENNLLLTNESKPKISETRIHLDHLSVAAYRSLLGGLYRGGFDKIHVDFDDKRVISNLEKAVNSIYGFEVFYVSEKSCVVRSIYSAEKTDIKSHINRIIYTIETMQQMIVEDISRGRYNSKEELLQLRNNVLKQRDLIVRIIKKKKLLGNDVFPYYTISLSLWGVARNYYHMYNDLEGMHDISFLEKTNEYFRRSFGNLGSVSMKEYLARHERYSKIYSECKELMGSDRIASYCMNIITQVQLTDSSIYLLNHG